MAKKTLLFYGTDSDAAKNKHPAVDKDTYQLIQADAYQGERLEADEIEFMDDVSPAEQARIRDLFGKFDNRQNMEKAGVAPASLGGVERTPASDRRNLNPETRVDDPKKVEPDQLKKPGVAPSLKPENNPGVQAREDKKGVGLDQTTGLKVDDRNKIPRNTDDHRASRNPK